MDKTTILITERPGIGWNAVFYTYRDSAVVDAVHALDNQECSRAAVVDINELFNGLKTLNLWVGINEEIDSEIPR